MSYKSLVVNGLEDVGFVKIEKRNVRENKYLTQ
jgi:hypothetical protein